MKQAVFFDTIPFPPPLKKIYSRLGFSRGKTIISPEQEKSLRTSLDEAFSLIELKGSARRIRIREQSADKIILESGLEIKSADLASFFSHAPEALFLGATAGGRIMDAIEELSRSGNLTKGVIFDAAASETVDGALQWIMNYCSQTLRREGKELFSRRFSAGYGDLALENQKIFFETLEMSKLGVQLTKNFILVPEKSVTAVTGITSA